MLKINIVKGFDDFVLSANVNITHVVGAGWAVVVDAHCEALVTAVLPLPRLA